MQMKPRWSGTLIADKLGNFFSRYRTSIMMDSVSTFEHVNGLTTLHLNAVVPEGSATFGMNTLFDLMEQLIQMKLWDVTPKQFSAVKLDILERVPLLLCDIGGLFAHEVDLVLGSQQSPMAYRLDHRFKGTTCLMKHTETFSVVDTNQPPKPAEQGNENMNTEAEQPKTLLVLINQFLGPNINISQIFQNHMLNGTGDFFVDQMDALQACHAIAPALPTLLSLAKDFTVELTVWSRCKPHHPGWDFKCTKRYTGPSGYETKLGDHDGDRPLVGIFGGTSYSYGPERYGIFGQHMNGFNMGMLNDPDSQFSNDAVCELLGLYSLVQINPLPAASARGRYFPAGLELLELVKRRLGYNHLGFPQTMMPTNMFNQAMPNTGNNPNGGGYASGFGFDPERSQFRPDLRGGGQNLSARYSSTDAPQGFDVATPDMQPGDVFKAKVIDRQTNRVLHIAANRDAQAWVVYVCTRQGNLLQRTQMPNGMAWIEYPGLPELLAIPTEIPCRTFEFDVSDTIEESIEAVNKGIHALSLSAGVHQSIRSQVRDVLLHKPINSSEFSKLHFTMAPRELMAEGLNAAIEGELLLSKAQARGCWIIHTDLPQDVSAMPERFWTLQDRTPRQSVY